MQRIDARCCAPSDRPRSSPAPAAGCTRPPPSPRRRAIGRPTRIASPASRLIRTAPVSGRRRRGTTAVRRRRGRMAICGPTVTGAGSTAAIYGCPAAGSRDAPAIAGFPATGAARAMCGSTSTATGDRRRSRGPAPPHRQRTPDSARRIGRQTRLDATADRRGAPARCRLHTDRPAERPLNSPHPPAFAHDAARRRSRDDARRPSGSSPASAS